MRNYIIMIAFALLAIIFPSGVSVAEANSTYTITPHSDTYENTYTTYTSLNDYTKHYYVIRSYLEHLEEIGGGTLELERGTYTVTNTLYVPSNVTIKLNNGVKLVKGSETGERVGLRAGEENINPSKSLFQFISPSKSDEKGVYGGYDGEKNISIIGSGSATIDLDFFPDSFAIVAGHNENLLIENISFINMNSGHFIEIDATKDAIIRNNKFMYSKPSPTLNKEAINIDTPDRSTLGWGFEWSTFDRTPNSNMLIENNHFYELDRAIGTHKYSGGMYHDQIIIRNNKIENMRNDAIIAMNWSNSIIENNFINHVEPGELNNKRGILANGVINPTFQNNVFANMPRAMQIYPWKNNGPGSQYDITYNELSDENIEALKTNTIINYEEDFIRINHIYDNFDKENSDWIEIQTERFYDLLEGESGYEETLDLVDRGIITGHGDHSFKPFDNISRQHVAVMLYRSLELDDPLNVNRTLANITDVSSKHEYAKEIAAVIEAEVFKGSNGKFSPNNNITRGQMASVLVRAFELEKKDTPVYLVDLNKIDKSHRENVEILAQNDITIGKLNNKGQRYFDAEGNLNRVQFATLLHRALVLTEASQENEAFENEIVKLTNEERKKHGLSPLKLDKNLRDVAREKSQDMVTNNYFEQHSPTFGSLADMLNTFNINYKIAGENHAKGFKTPEAVVKGWMNSPDHRNNMLHKDFTHIGVGFADPDRVLTQLFIRKKVMTNGR